MTTSTLNRILLLFVTLIFLAWTALYTVCWPLEDYGNVIHAYTESTNLIVRGMALGLAGYLSAISLIIGWNITRPAEAKLEKSATKP